MSALRALFRLSGRLWLAVALGFALRAGYAAWAVTSGVSYSHMDEYETIAKRLVADGRYDYAPGKPTALREPAFVFFIAGLYAVAGERPLAVVLAQSVLAILTCLFLRGLAARLWGEDAGDAALLLSLFYPYFVFYCGYFYRETFLCFAAAGALWASSLFLERPAAGRGLAAGAFLGICATTFSSWIPIAGAATLYLLWRALRRGPRPWAGAAALALAAALPLAAWIGRNYAVFGRLIPGATLGGFNLYTSLIVPDEFRGTERELEFKLADPHWSRIMSMYSSLIEDDGSQQEAFMKAAAARIKERPGEYLRHAAAQAAKLWRLYPYPRSYQHSYAKIKALSLASDGWIIPLGLVFLWRRRRDGPELGLFWTVLGSGTLLYALVSAIVRYRLPLMLPLLAGAAAALAGLPAVRRGLGALR